MARSGSHWTIAVGQWVPMRGFTVERCMVVVVSLRPFLIVCSWAI